MGERIGVTRTKNGQSSAPCLRLNAGDGRAVHRIIGVTSRACCGLRGRALVATLAGRVW